MCYEVNIHFINIKHLFFYIFVIKIWKNQIIVADFYIVEFCFCTLGTLSTPSLLTNTDVLFLNGDLGDCFLVRFDLLDFLDFLDEWANNVCGES